MCCLFGLIDYRGTLSGKQKSRILSTLAVEAENRGTDATGIAYCQDGEIVIHKRPVAAHRMRIRIPKTVRTVMGHTRMTTQGNAVKNCNNHPFPGEARNTAFALAHNGVLYNDDLLRKSLSLPATNIETDSYVAVQILERAGFLNFSNLGFMAEQMRGTFCFTVLDHEEALYLVKGNNPLVIFHFPKLGCYLYASTLAILSQAVKRCSLRTQLYEQVSIEGGDILRIDSHGDITRSFFSTENLVDERFLFYPRYTPAYVTTAPEVDTYLEELKTFASFEGIDPRIIDHLYEDGFSTDDIEEILFNGEL